MPDLAAALAAALAAVLSPGVTLGEGRVHALWPGEALPGAVPARRAEFAQGRSAARTAMRALGVAPCAIPMKDDRSPQWPAGLTGSISHCEGACFAILGRTSTYHGLGLDIEPARPLPRDLWPVILRSEERDTSDPLAVFAAKEAVYKAQYALTGTLFDFHTLLVALSGDVFTATFQHAIGCFASGAVINGALVRTHRHTAAVCAISA